MTHSKTTSVVAVASIAVVASVAVFFSIPKQTHPERAVGNTAAPESEKQIGISPPHSSVVAPAQAGPDAAVDTLPPVESSSDLEIHKKATKAFIAHMHENTRRLYGGFFQSKGLSPAIQTEMTMILSQPMQALTDESIVAMRAGVRTTPPSPETLRAERSRQDQALRSLLGEGGFAEFSDYRRTIPDRIIVQGMQRQGAELSEEQSQQILQILTEERRKLSGGTAGGQNPDLLPPGEVMSKIRQDQEQLRDAVNRRAESVLTREQVAAMGDVFERLIRPPMPRQ